MNELISIIIPVFNAENTIENCINSILNQTYSNFEIIIIDDGSHDGSLIKCKNVSKNDSRIKVFSIENAGVSNARNYGIKKSRGKYIGFIDSDDIIDMDMYEILYNNIVHSNSDISICGYSIVYNNGKIEKRNGTNKLFELNCVEAMKMLLNDKYFGGGVWNKLFKTEVLKNIKFNTNFAYNEDRLFLTQCILNSNKIIYEDCCKYNYIKNSESATNKKITSGTKMIQIIPVNHLIRDYTEKKEKSLNDYLIVNEITSMIDLYRTFCLKTSVFSLSYEKEIIRNELKKYTYNSLLEKFYKYELFFIKRIPILYYLIIRLSNNSFTKNIRKKKLGD